MRIPVWAVVIAGVASAGLGVVLLVAVLLLQTEATGADDAALLLTAQVQPTATTVPYTGIPTPISTSSVVPLDMPDTPPFRIILPENNMPLIADGRSGRTLAMETLLPDAVGREVLLVVNGGGVLEPERVSLAAVGETVTITYTASTSPGTVRIDGVLPLGGASLRVSTQIEMQAEAAVMDGQYDVANADGHIPITLGMRTAERTTIQGLYAVRLRVLEGGGYVYLPPDNGPINEITLDATTPARTVYYVPDGSSERAGFEAKVIGRPDIPTYQTDVFWRQIGTQTTLLNIPQNGRLDWYALQPSRTCFHVFTGGVPVSPPIARISYDVLLAPPSASAMLAVNGRTLTPGTQLTSTDEAFIQRGAPTCFTVTHAGAPAGGLLRLHVSGALAQYGDRTLALVHYGRVWQPGSATQITLQSGGNPAGALPISEGLMPEVYMVQSEAQQIVLALIWVRGKHIGTEDAVPTLLRNPQDPTLASYNATSPGAVPVEVTFTADAITDVYVPDIEGGVLPDSETLYPVYALGRLTQPTSPDTD